MAGGGSTGRCGDALNTIMKHDRLHTYVDKYVYDYVDTSVDKYVHDYVPHPKWPPSKRIWKCYASNAVPFKWSEKWYAESAPHFDTPQCSQK